MLLMQGYWIGLVSYRNLHKFHQLEIKENIIDICMYQLESN